MSREVAALPFQANANDGTRSIDFDLNPWNLICIPQLKKHNLHNIILLSWKEYAICKAHKTTNKEIFEQ